MLDKIKETWNKLPKTIKVFFYLLVSGLLAELATDLNLIADVWWARYLLIPINLAIVFLEGAVPEVVARLKR